MATHSRPSGSLSTPSSQWGLPVPAWAAWLWSAWHCRAMQPELVWVFSKGKQVALVTKTMMWCLWHSEHLQSNILTPWDGHCMSSSPFYRRGSGAQSDTLEENVLFTTCLADVTRTRSTKGSYRHRAPPYTQENQILGIHYNRALALQGHQDEEHWPTRKLLLELFCNLASFHAFISTHYLKLPSF